MKKRIISLLLCAAMLLSLAPIALAEKAAENIEASKSIPLEGNVAFAEQMTDEAETETAPHQSAALTASPEGEALDAAKPSPLGEGAEQSEADEGKEIAPEDAAIKPAETEEPLLGAASGTCGENLTWSLDDDGTLTISGTGDMEDYKEYGAPWYSIRSNLQAVVLEDGVNSIGAHAFDYCPFTTATIAESVTNIGDCAFYYCSNLTSVKLSENVERVGLKAFYCCGSLVRVSISSGLTEFAGATFASCTSLPRVAIPEGAAMICSSMFSNCSSLKNVTIPDSVTSIGDGAFSSCSSLTSVTIPDSVTSIGDSVFSNCSSLTSVTIPDSVTSIGNNAFYNCSSLTSVTIPDSVTSIGDSAFLCCSSLTSVTIPDSVTSLGNEAFRACRNLQSAVIGSGVTTLGVFNTTTNTGTFSGCALLTNVTISDSVTGIGNYTFSGCKALENITIPDSVTQIGPFAFADSGLTQIVIPDSVTTLSGAAFFRCNNLQSAVIGNGIKNLSCYTSYGWSSNTYWGTFQNCTALTDVTLGRNIVTIDNATFHGCTALQTIKIPENTVRINDSAFSGCSALESIAIPDMTVQIGASAFSGCSALSDIYYGGTEEDWTYITIGSGNDALTGATLHVTDVPHTHSYDSGVVKAEPTCTKAGVKVYTCAECGDSYTEAIPATGHAWDHGVITLQPTLTETGVRTYTCQNDAAHTYTEILPVLNSDAPTLSIIGGKVQPGKTVAVSLALANNPGIAGMRLRLAYDSVLTLTNVETADALSDLTFTQPGDLTANPVTLFWDGLDADDASGTILTLFFTVAAGTADGEYPITVTYTSGEIYDGSMQDVTLAIKNGVVTVKNYILGDANGDDLVNGKDVTILRQFLAGGYDVTIDELAADANRDGKANGKDVTMLRQYLAGGYGITLE